MIYSNIRNKIIEMLEDESRWDHNQILTLRIAKHIKMRPDLTYRLLYRMKKEGLISHPYRDLNGRGYHWCLPKKEKEND